ncbi:MAG: CoA transferase subunit A [Deltaproteobacteria bacterium]|nr:CoA transferase subunit A [Deltaproteobacteria bacterium]MBW2133456.1 CoA transferase subunit A [Deltaproteobacteria bacterium]
MDFTKRLSLSEAVSRFVQDGDSVAMGCAQETLIPFAAGHEMIRRQKKNLTLIGPISDILFDQLVGAGCVAEIRAAWIGNVITGSAYHFRRAVEEKTLRIKDHSNLTLAMALKAGAMGVPFMPTSTALGSDLYRTNPDLKTVSCPFSGVPVTAVAALTPDVAVVHVQRADIFGNSHVWGNLGVTREACLASRHVILTAEEIVDTKVITGDPNRVVVPGFRVSAVVHAPWGGHPSPVPGYYNRDHQAFIDYRNCSKTPEGFRAWRKEWVDPVDDGRTYAEILGKARRESLAIKHRRPSVPVDYGY